MTSRLQRWGERALGRAHVVEPRIASRFEQAARVDADFVVQEAEVAMSHAETASRRAVAPPSRPIDEAPPAVAPSAPPAPSSRVVRAHEPSQPASPLPRSPRAAKPPAERSVPARAVVIEPLPRQTDRAGAEQPESTREERAIDAPARGPRPNARSLEAAIAKLQAWMERDDEPERTEVAEPVHEPPPALARPVANNVSPRATDERRAGVAERASRVPPIALAPAAAMPPPRIEVHIDTIVVRAASPRAPSPRAQPAAGLASFLARRTAGRL